MSIIVAISAILLIGIVVNYAYNSVYLPSQKDKIFSDVANANPNGQTITIFMYHVDWCPHCKTALPEWQMFESEYHAKMANGYRIECIKVNCTDSKDPKVKDLTTKYKIEYFPTVKGVMQNGGQEIVVEYDATVTRAHLESFVQSLTSQNGEF